ncbi:2-succinyl-6-hydroxy-2,4-cyclohexadiene-1-carboxylate synthase [Shewanella intestini]|uniref:Putative 2-succinyl-6-hydroxy-2,4-cyclohexadiene-1-carboxylate synthase n=1 Tax=Shewanella intestini TaxID=2017544 RepID=A0ABS5I3Z1_9GAMM|nr:MULTISPECIES: 2-succinyl-6-hydroxy-2,4-cyclohexadiene-1-carboxylate synthase [Shewanella]MBR9728739.1 2-succinyl-6-hydroxy-2,4-cyclohexadiene-1-carboxylate synthase [Shewanella intestini]MRG36815.1 2-succinyl-6-hydroxy-2,4-cyclohexadiene-1-carboxylate synthase [Shewanella sp. XMDDZSB0408]
MIKVSRFGQPERPNLVLIHGFMGAKEDWLACMPILSLHFHCICIDLPGHGESTLSLPTPGFDALVSAIMTTLQHLNCHQFHLLGYSLGGRVALHIAKQHPQSLLSLTLESAHPGLSDIKAKAARLHADQQWADKLQHLPLKQFLSLWYQQAVFSDLTAEQTLALIEQRSQNQPDALLNCYLATSLGHQQDCRNAVAAIAPHCHIIVGEQDAKFLALAQQWQQQQPINVLVIKQAGHNIHSHHHHAFCQQLLAVISPEPIG